MQIIAAFLNMIGTIIKSAFSVVGGVLKFTLGTIVIILILLVLLVLGLLHAVGAI